MIKCIIVEDEELAQDVIQSHLENFRDLELVGVFRNAQEADIALQTPQSLGLRRCQSKPRHFYILALDPLKHVVDTHGAPLGTPHEALDLAV